MTQRSDLIDERGFLSILDSLLDEGAIAQVQVSEPCPYLPDNEEFSDQILVHYIGYTIK
jgi:hypothetical protein